MTDTILDTLIVKVRADTTAAQQSVARMNADISLLGVGAESASKQIENSFVRFARTGEFSFKSLRDLALGVLGDIASAAVRSGIENIFGSIGGAGGGGGLLSSIGALFGLPGRATGGPVSAGTPYLVGERGPELFVPQQAGRVQANGATASRSVAITINMTGGARDVRGMAQSANQVATAVRRAIARSEGLA
jgi:phage-related minor tail protein